MKSLDNQFKKLESTISNRPEKNESGLMMTYTFPIGTTWSEEILSINMKNFTNRKLAKFENERFYIPQDFNNLLISRYGDYMKLPEDEGQISNHLWSKE